MFREATTDFTVDARALTKSGGNHIKTNINNPSGQHTDSLIRDLGDGTYQVEYTPYEEGETACLTHFSLRHLQKMPAENGKTAYKNGRTDYKNLDISAFKCNFMLCAPEAKTPILPLEWVHSTLAYPHI